VHGTWVRYTTEAHDKHLCDSMVIVYADGDLECLSLQALNRQRVEWLPEDWQVPRGVVFRTPAQAEDELTRREQEVATLIQTGDSS
jgi:DNA-binding NarL/FixJ family response regulator